MASDKLLPLKFAVYAMGIMLLGGFLWLGGKLALKAQELNSDNCADIEIAPSDINSSLQLKSATINGDNLLITYANQQQTTILRYDRCGKLQQKFNIKH